MFNFLLPDYYYHSIHDVPMSFYEENAIKAVLFDIDNTLEPYATPVPSEKTLKLFNLLKENGIKLAIISNNHEPRVREFCSSLDVIYSFDSGKPSNKKINEIIDKLNAEKTEVLIIGDQLFTDIWASHTSKIRSMFVDRINNSEGFFIKVKRILELPFVAYIKKKGVGKIK